MEYLLMMTLSGSTMTVTCWLLRFLLRNRISARSYYLLAKAAVLYYLIPLPFLKGWYSKVLRVIVPEDKMEIAHISLARINYMVNADGSVYVNRYAKNQIGMVLIWLTVAIFLMARRLVKYFRSVRWIAGYTSTKMTDRQKTYIVGLKEEYGIRRNVLLYQGETGDSSMTFGIYRPVIICGREVGSREAELLIRHELVHIKRLDALWKMFMQFVIFLHWCNPVMWSLYFALDRFCELSCDETVMRGKAKTEVDEYLLLLIEEAQREEEHKKKKISLKWKVGFSSSMRRVRERMDNLMKNKRWNRFAVGTLVAALIFANSMTAFAYKDGHNEVMPEDMTQETIEEALESDTILFFPEDTGEEVIQDFDMRGTTEILYDRQFVDEEGNIYPVPEVEPQWGCDHTYEPGTEQRHNKYSDGSCKVTEYKAERCTKCGTIKLGEQIGWRKYDVCPH